MYLFNNHTRTTHTVCMYRAFEASPSTFDLAPHARISLRVACKPTVADMYYEQTLQIFSIFKNMRSFRLADPATLPPPYLAEVSCLWFVNAAIPSIPISHIHAHTHTVTHSIPIKRHSCLVSLSTLAKWCLSRVHLVIAHCKH